MELNRYIEWVQRDFWVVVICLMSLLACLYTALQVGTYEAAINRAWALQWERSGCEAIYTNVSMKFDMLGRYPSPSPGPVPASLPGGP